MKKKVCMIVGNPFVNDSRVYKESQSLTKAGYKVIIYATKKFDLPKVEEVDGVIIKRLVHNFSPLRPKIWRYFQELYPTYKKLVKEKADVYHAHDLDTLFICHKSAQRNKAKLVYDSHELFTKRVYKLGVSWKDYLKDLATHPLWVLMEKILAPKADAVITVNESISEILKKTFDLSYVEVIMNCPRLNYTKVAKGKKFHKMFNLNDDTKIVLYQGGLSLARGNREIIQSIPMWDKNTALIFMGNGAIRKGLEKLTKELNIQNRVKFLDAVPLETLPGFTASADVGIFPYLNVGPNYYYVLPNKLFEYLSVGLPVVASDFPEVRKVLKYKGAGLTFNPESSNSIARAVNRIFADENKLTEMSYKAKETVVEMYNWENQEKILLKLYQRLLS